MIYLKILHTLGKYSSTSFARAELSGLQGFDNIIFPGTCLPAGRAQCRVVHHKKMEYFVYAIKSGIDGRIYVGITQNIERRLKEHNNGNTKSTKAYRPWELLFKSKFDNRLRARKEEKKLKSGYGKEYLKSLVYINLPR